MADATVTLENEAAQSTNALGPLIGVAREDFVSAVALLLRDLEPDPALLADDASSVTEDMVTMSTCRSEPEHEHKNKSLMEPAEP